MSDLIQVLCLCRYLLILLYLSACVSECVPVCALARASSFIKTRIQIELRLPASSTLISDAQREGRSGEKGEEEKEGWSRLPASRQCVSSSTLLSQNFSFSALSPVSPPRTPPWSDSYKNQPAYNTHFTHTHTHMNTAPELFSNLVCCQLVVVGQRQTVDWAVRLSKPIISLEFT